MKKSITITLLLCVITLAANAQKASLIKGKWIFKDIADKETLDATILNQAKTMFAKTELDFGSNSKLTYNPLSSNSNSLFTGTWELNKEENKIFVSLTHPSNGSKQTSEWEIKGLTQTELKLNMGNAVIIFGKPKTELISYPFQGQNGKFGFKSPSGKILIEPKYTWALPESDGMIAVNIGAQFNESKRTFEGGKWTYIDSTGKEITNFIYDEAFPFAGGYALVIIGKKEGLLDKSGKEIIPVSFDEIGERVDMVPGKTSPFHDGLIRVRQNEKWGFIDKTGKVVVPLIYSNAHNLSEGLGAVEQKGKWGFIDKTGKVVVPLIYSNAYDFSEGLGAVEQKGKWGFIDKTGKVVILLKYDWVGYDMGFKKGRAEVQLDGEVFYIDKTGKKVK